MTLPGRDELFDRLCRPWYPPQGRERRSAGRPDLEPAAPPMTAVRTVHGVPPEAAPYMQTALAHTLRAVEEEWPRELGLPPGRPTRAWIDAFDRAWDAARVAALIARADPDRRDNAYLKTAVALGVALGAVVLDAVPRTAWLLEAPFWESAVYDGRSGTRVNVFHWALRRLSRDGLDEGLAAKLDSCLTALRPSPRAE